MYNVQKEEYDWAQRTTFVVDKKGVIQSVEKKLAPSIPTMPSPFAQSCRKNSAQPHGGAMRMPSQTGLVSA